MVLFGLEMVTVTGTRYMSLVLTGRMHGQWNSAEAVITELSLLQGNTDDYVEFSGSWWWRNCVELLDGSNNLASVV